jgi:cytoskeletal protein CcmA (bactofilin family)
MGDILGKGKVELGPRARVEGDITSTTLAIAEGAFFRGRSIMGGEATETRNGRETARPAEQFATPGSAGTRSAS